MQTKSNSRGLNRRKVFTYLLIGVIGFVFFIASFPDSSFKYYKTNPQRDVFFYVISPKYKINFLRPKIEITYDEFKYEQKKGNLKGTSNLIGRPYPYIVGLAIFLVLLFTDPLKERFLDTNSKNESVNSQGTNAL